MQGRKIIALAMLLSFACAASPLSAALIHVAMTAEIQSTDPDGPFAGATGTVSAEALFPDTGVETTGYYLFYDNVGSYEFSGEPYSMRFDLGTPGEFEWFGTDVGVVETNRVGVEVSDGHWLPDQDDVYLTTLNQGVLYHMMFFGPAGSLSGDDIPGVDTLNSFYDNAIILVRNPFGQPEWLVASATDVTFTEMAVPLPASLWLMLSGLAGFTACARKRRIPL